MIADNECFSNTLSDNYKYIEDIEKELVLLSIRHPIISKITRYLYSFKLAKKYLIRLRSSVKKNPTMRLKFDRYFN